MLECQDCHTTFAANGSHVEDVVSGGCQNCGGVLAPFRDQPTPIRSDMELRNMVDPGSGKDMGGNPLREGILGDWDSRMKRDESYASVKKADAVPGDEEDVVSIIGQDRYDEWQYSADGAEPPLEPLEEMIYDAGGTPPWQSNVKVAFDDMDFSLGFDDDPGDSFKSSEPTHKFIVTPKGECFALPEPTTHEAISNHFKLGEQGLLGSSLGIIHDDGTTNWFQHSSGLNPAELKEIVERQFGMPVEIDPNLKPSSNEERWGLDGLTHTPFERSRPGYEDKVKKEQEYLQMRDNRPFPYYENPAFNRGGKVSDTPDTLNITPHMPWTHESADFETEEVIPPGGNTIEATPSDAGLHNEVVAGLQQLGVHVNGKPVDEAHGKELITHHSPLGQMMSPESKWEENKGRPVTITHDDPDVLHTARKVIETGSGAPIREWHKSVHNAHQEESEVHPEGLNKDIIQGLGNLDTYVNGRRLRDYYKQIMAEHKGESLTVGAKSPEELEVAKQVLQTGSSNPAREYRQRTGAVETPGSIDSIGVTDDDPESVDTKEVNDGDSTPGEDLKIDDLGAGSNASPFAEDSKSPELLEQAFPLLLYYAESDESAKDDPDLKDLFELLDKEAPGLSDKYNDEKHDGDVERLIESLFESDDTKKKETSEKIAVVPIAALGIGTAARAGAPWVIGGLGRLTGLAAARGGTAAAGSAAKKGLGSKLLGMAGRSALMHGAINAVKGDDKGEGAGAAPEEELGVRGMGQLAAVESYAPSGPPNAQSPVGMNPGQPFLQPGNNNQVQNGQAGVQCPSCGAGLGPDGRCVSCGYGNPGHDNSQPGAQNAQAGPGGFAPPTVARTSHQGPNTQAQFAAVAQYLEEQGRGEEVTKMLQEPWNYAAELGEVQNNSNKLPPEQQQPQEEQEVPPEMQQPQAMPPAPNDISMQMQGAIERWGSDNLAPKCPECSSHTTGLGNSQGDCYCHSCGNTWTVDSVRPDNVEKPKLADAHSHDELHNVDRAPAADREKPRDVRAEQDSSFSWTTDNGDPLIAGQEYEMHSPKYDIPDLVRVERVKPDSIEYTILGEYNMEHRTELTREAFDMDQLSFIPVEEGEEDPTQEEQQATYPETAPGETSDLSTPHIRSNVEIEPTPTPEPPQVRPEPTTACRKCQSSHITSSMLSPEREGFECFKCGHEWQQGVDDAPVDIDAILNEEDRAWIKEDESFDVGIAAIPTTSGESRSIAQAATRTAGRKMTPMEQRDYIDEQGIARNSDKLRLEGTHYETRFDPKGDAGNVSEDYLAFGI